MARPLTSELLAIPKRLDDLPTPPEVAEAARQYIKKLGLFRKKTLKSIEDELKLQYYYGGWYIRCLPTKQGKVIVALDQGDEEECERQVQALSPEDRRESVVHVPSIWNNETSIITGFWDYED